MVDLGKRGDIKKLRESMRNSRRKLEDFVQAQYRMVNEYIGSNYGERKGGSSQVPVPFIEMAVTALAAYLAGGEPRSLVIAQSDPQLSGQAATLELAVNRLVQQIKLQDAFYDCTIQALFSVGIMKVALERTSSVEIGGFTHDVGQPYADVVLLEDWVHDMSAKRWDQIDYCGNRYQLDLEEAKKAEGFESAQRAKLKATDGEVLGGPKNELAELSGADKPEADRYRPKVSLWDIWLPKDGLLVTFADDALDSDDKPLRVIEWDGPENGPYHLLSFNRVPGNLMPLAPVSLIMDLHELANSLWRKLSRQAERQKTLGVIPGYGQGNDVIDANDGDLLRGQGMPHEMRLGGPDQANLSLFLVVKDLISQFGGNLNLLAGLGTESETLGQDQLLNARASRRVGRMQGSVVQFAATVMKDLAWYLWTDPLIDMPLTKRVAGTDLTIPTSFKAEQREGEFLDYELLIAPHSMEYKSPAQRLQTIMAGLNQLTPHLPMMQQQGISLNYERLVRILAKYSDTPEFEQILDFGGQPSQEQMAQEETRMPAMTQREYVRTNRSGASMRGSEDALRRALIGGNPQDGEMAQIGRM